MNDTNMEIGKLIKMLHSPKANIRYDACEELRVASAITPEAIEALQNAINDPDASVAESAQSALNVHLPPEPTSNDSKENQYASNDNPKQPQPQSQQGKAEPSTLGCLLTFVIAIGASILAGVIYGGGAVSNVNTLNGMGEMAGNLVWVIIITLIVTGVIVNAIMTKLLPKKPTLPNNTKSKDN